ncbi:LamB/YcsF family protein [Cochleicola gelatinilyticus]|uniref:Lactam utilization protein LamB n=1 Tax=Cochleicola gelatinilyticus TaxID=1763537 RepID=A0A167HNK2_9FLAO|nr:LamB/YcsF family protein [Cochleicola gelatinilyticus]OAB78799.1 hypothetical protein ULVI_09465 [Cochleicola gelatinilyticus]
MIPPLLIDINADLGEGSGQDIELMPLISSCNIASGGHYGNIDSMRTTIQLAKANKVYIGAHPSFPDPANFGRKRLSMTKRELTETIYNQLMHFITICNTERTSMHHVKLHGALYNYAAIDAPTADAVIEAILATNTRPQLVAPFNSILAKKANNLLPLVFEAFIDRRYTDDLSLVSRSKPNAIITTAEEAWHQFYQLINKQSVTTVHNTIRSLKADTFCIHGDHENSISILKYIHSQMKKFNIHLKKDINNV